VHAERSGNGPRAVIGIHGWAGSSRTWRRLAPYVDSGSSFYALDLPGYGQTPLPDTLSLDAVLDATGKYLATIESDEIVLVGNCGGALFAIEAARRFGPRIKRVIMLDPFGYPPLYFRIFLWGEFGRYAYLTTFANPMGRWLTNGALRAKRASDTDLTQGFRDTNHDLALKYLHMLRPVAVAERYKGVTCAVDILYGERTFSAVRKSLPLWLEALPQANCIMLSGAGHEPVKEATDQLGRFVFSHHPLRNANDGVTPDAVATKR
jgi:pimeloyl-ACP methyl ester carboxylesterase